MVKRVTHHPNITMKPVLQFKPHSTALDGEPINTELKAHALGTKWEHHEAITLFHEWAEIFNREFRLGLEVPAIAIDKMSARLYGTYCRGRNALGLQHEIQLNERHLARPLAQTLSTILHEQLHQWQEQWGRGGRNGYHNQEFRVMAKRFGLVVDERGHTLGIEPGPFTKLLAEHGVDMNTLPPPPGDVPPLGAKLPHGDSKMKKWRCSCSPPINVRCAVELTARCLRCGSLFEESRPLW